MCVTAISILQSTITFTGKKVVSGLIQENVDDWSSESLLFFVVREPEKVQQHRILSI